MLKFLGGISVITCETKVRISLLKLTNKAVKIEIKPLFLELNYSSYANFQLHIIPFYFIIHGGL